MLKSDAALKGLLEKSVQNITRKTFSESQVDLNKALQVSKVAAKSPAALLGIEPGDYLLKVDQEHALNFDFSEVATWGGVKPFQFFSKSKSELLSFSSDGVPLGINYQKTAVGIAQAYNWWSGEPDDLIDLWERYEDETLLKLVESWSKKKVLSLEQKLPSALSRIFLLNPRELLITGIAFYENEQYDAGLYYIMRFVEEHMHGWTSNWHGLSYYYLALESLRQEQTEEAIELMQDAYSYWPIDRIKRRLQLLGVEQKEMHQTGRWVDQKFPVQYKLSDIKQAEKTSLQQTLDEMEPHQLLAVCSLGPYRSNGPYDSFMNAFVRYQQYFANILYGMHVLTANEYNTDWLDNEQLAFAKGRPLRVLLDEESQVAQELASSASPEIYLLDKDAKVIAYWDWDDEVAFWDLMIKRIDN